MELNKTFIDGLWSKEINVTSFVQTNITPYKTMQDTAIDKYAATFM